jgi:Domain of unknown function (DUF1929)
MPATPRPPQDDAAPDPREEYERRSRLAGEPVKASRAYEVRLRRLDRSRPLVARVLVVAVLLFVGGFFAWVMLPSHWPHGAHDPAVQVASIVMTITTGVIGLFAFLNVSALCRATLLARDPVPVHAPPGRRVAFAVTHVTDPEQRSVALDVSRYLGAVKLGIPRSAGLLPAGWYMLFVTNREGTPSKARWVRVT